MKYNTYDINIITKEDFLHKIVWACCYEPTNARNEKLFYCKPVKGMLTLQYYGADKERKDSETYSSYTHYPVRYFVPFRKNAKELTLENLAWSKAVGVKSRCYADTEAESIEQYNEMVISSIKELLIIAANDAKDVLIDHLTPEQVKIINSLNNIKILKSKNLN